MPEKENPIVQNPFVQGLLKDWDYAFKRSFNATQALLKIVRRVGPLVEGGDELLKEVRDEAMGGLDRDLCLKCFEEVVPVKREEAGKGDGKGEKIYFCKRCGRNWKEGEVLKGGNRVIWGGEPVEDEKDQGKVADLK